MAFRLEDRHLVMLAERFPKNWDLTVLGEVVLGLKDYEVDAIKTNHSGDVKQAAHELLKKWNGRQSDPGDAYHQLKTRLRSVQDFTSLATALEQWVERGMDQPGTSMCDISDIQQTVRDYLEVELEDSLYNDWLKCDDRKALPLMYLYTDLKWTIKVEKRVGSDRWEERSSVFDILPGQQDKPMKILVEAAAGMGKTSTVSYLAMNWVQHNEKIPFDLVFQVPLRVLNQLDADTSLAEIIQSNNGLEDVSSSRVEAILRGDTKSKVLLILDGYDEYNGKITALNEVVEKNVNSFFLLITSRPGKDPSDETYIKKAVRDKMQRQVMIEGFTDDSIEKCCKLFLDDNEDLKEAMLEQVRQKSAMGTSGYSGLWELLRTPITLLMMCALLKQHGTLPKTRTQIYKQIRELSVERTLNKPGSPLINRQNLEQTLYRLGEFAWKALQEDNLLLSKRALQEKDGDILRLGLLHEVGGDSMSLRKKEIFVSFQHKTMQEFVAAEYVAECVDQSSNKKATLQKILCPVNVYSLRSEIVYFCASLLLNVTPLVELVSELSSEKRSKRSQVITVSLDNELLDEISREAEVESVYSDLIRFVLQRSPELDLYQNTLQGALPKLLPTDSNLEVLEGLGLIVTRMNLSDIKHLAGLLRNGNLPRLKSLDLSYNVLTGHLLQFRFDSPHPCLEILNLGTTWLNGVDIIHVFHLVMGGNLPALKGLSLSGNVLTGFLKILAPESPLPSLILLDLCDTDLNLPDVQHVGGLIRAGKLPALEELDVSYNSLTRVLPELLPPEGALQSLTLLLLTMTELNQSDVEHLGALIKDQKLPSLRGLLISENYLGGRLHLLFPKGSPFPSLEELHLKNTELSESDVQYLGCVMGEGTLPALKILILSITRLTGFLPELRLESPHQSLEDLDLGFTELNKSDVQHLGGLLRNKTFPALKELDLSHNTLTGLLPELLVNSIQSLEKLSMVETELNKSDIKCLAGLVGGGKLPRLVFLSLYSKHLRDMEDECGELVEACVTHRQMELTEADVSHPKMELGEAEVTHQQMEVTEEQATHHQRWVGEEAGVTHHQMELEMACVSHPKMDLGEGEVTPHQMELTTEEVTHHQRELTEEEVTPHQRELSLLLINSDLSKKFKDKYRRLCEGTRVDLRV